VECGLEWKKSHFPPIQLQALPNGAYAVERDSNSIAKFLNRLLGLPVYAQNQLFQYFNDISEELVKQAKIDGTFDMGILGDHNTKINSHN
jgi:hypothetical protein